MSEELDDVPEIHIYECDHCAIAIGTEKARLPKMLKVEFDVRWRRVGDNSPGASDRERIAYFISNNLPDESFLDAAETIDQLKEWVESKDSAIWIAMCFVSGRSQPDNPLKRCLEEGIIDQWFHDYTWLVADLYENWWRLIDLKWKLISAAMKKIGEVDKDWDFPFKSSRELFEEILREEFDNLFLQCMKPWHKEKPQDNWEMATLTRKFIRKEHTPEEEKKLADLQKSRFIKHVWTERVFQVARVLAEKDAFIRARIAIYDELMYALSGLDQQACTPKFRHHRPSIEWWRGEKYIKKKFDQGWTRNKTLQ